MPHWARQRQRVKIEPGDTVICAPWPHDAPAPGARWVLKNTRLSRKEDDALCAVLEKRYRRASLDTRIQNLIAEQMTNAELYACALGQPYAPVK